MQTTVIKNAKRNIFFGAINKAILLLCPFIERTIVQIVLGAQYLGLGSLYTSILSVLSLTELGFNSAMVYNMFKPAAEGDTAKVNALLHFYKKIYRIIGLVVIALGLVLIPFLPHLIKGSYPADIDLTTLYLIYLGNSAISYFLFAYMTAILVVHQRDDVQSSVNSLIKIMLTASQAGILLAFRNYYLYVLLLPVFTVANNLWVAWRVRRLFPQYRPEGDITEEDRKGIRKLVTGTFIQRACVVTRNSLDSICISAFLGLTLTAIYNNYYLVINGVTTFVGVISAAFAGGVGNHVATKSVEENFDELQRIDFTYLWLGGWCTICLLCLYQPFMELWMGKEMMLSFPAVVLLSLYFYLLKLGDMLTLYSSAKGLWWEHRYRSICETLLNLVLNITLGKLFGVYGIILATMLALVLCNYLWSTRIVFRAYFTLGRLKTFYRSQGTQTVLTLAVCALTYLLCTLLPVKTPAAALVCRAAICIVVPNALFYLVFRKTEKFQYARKAILGR